MVEQILNWTNEIIESNTDLIGLAGKRRSKFEGWLKFELARKAFLNGATSICIEGSNQNIRRCDLSFTFNNTLYFMELKTPNTSLQIKELRIFKNLLLLNPT